MSIVLEQKIPESSQEVSHQERAHRAKAQIDVEHYKAVLRSEYDGDCTASELRETEKNVQKAE
jgi:hypothetical protein